MRRKAFSIISQTLTFLRYVETFEGTALYERESVIIFDEVQLYPVARQAIKHLVADGRYDYIETGSLISIHKNVESIVIPSEEEPINMYPMDYEEFRWAMGDVATMPLLKEMYQKSQSLGDGVNRKLMLDFRLYMLIGGMPQAVNTYLQTHDFLKWIRLSEVLYAYTCRTSTKLTPTKGQLHFSTPFLRSYIRTQAATSPHRCWKTPTMNVWHQYCI